MTKLLPALKLSGSTIALASMFAFAATAQAQSASSQTTPANAVAAQDNPVPPSAGSGQDLPPEQDAANPGDDIVVTGSAIRGVAPVGSNLVSVGQEALAKTAATSTTELVNTVPAITTAGSTPQAQSAYSYYAPQIHSLAGSGSNTTLALIDGLRMPGGGLQYAQTDPNIIPTPALQRVEVLADGASSIYGSDAVAGVVNFITRKTFEGLQINGRVGFAADYRSYDLNGIWGTKWETGGVYIAGQFLKQQEITNDKRGFLSRGDYRDIGGSNTNTYNCSPATVRGSSSATVIYPSPDATATLPNNQAANGMCNTSIYGSAVPGVQREGVLVVVNQELADRLTFTGKFVYNHLQHFSTGTPGTLSNAQTFGAGSGRGTQINPFFRAPPGSGFTQELVNWLALTPDGDYGTNNYQNTTFYTTGVIDYKVTDKWSITASGALARSNSYQRGRNVFCSTCATLALNGSPALNGTITSVLPGQPGQSGTVSQALTTANALDVWNGLGNNRTAATVWDYIYSNNTNNEHQNNMYQLKLEVQGELFSLPGGGVRMAAGGEFMHATQDVYGLNPNSTGTGYTNFIMNLGPRNVKSGYLELYVPVVSEDMDIPLVKKFDLSLSGRIDHYSDFGSTKNPKIAANWQINDWIKIRGNWAESFVAPPLNQIGDPRQGYLRGATGTNASAVLDVPVAAYPEVKQLPGCETATVTCRVGANTGREGLDRSLGAGFAGVVPQTGSSWSVGLDVNPSFMPGFTANVTYWANVFKGGVASPAQPLIINSKALHDRLTICPTSCTADQIRTFTNVANGATTSPTLPSTVYFLINRDVGNVLNLNVQGIDAQFQYRVPTAGIGTFTVGGSITYFTRFMQDFGDEPFSILNTSGYNSQFPSIQTKGRGQLSWELGDFSLDLFGNYTGAYRNWIQTSVRPVTLGSNGNPTGGGDRVKPDFTVDLHAAYEFKGNFLNGSQVYIDVKNLFDRDPPFYNGNTTGAGGVGAWGFNGFTSNLLGRLISVGFRANF